MTKPLAYSYIRFSHPDQAKGDSLRRQAELRDAWLTRSGVSLDTSLTLEDKGVSGFSGDHRDNPDRHALAAFVGLVKRNSIPRGSYLIVESLDRLSREDIIPALSLLLDLIQSGIRVVQLLPIETVYDAQSNPMHLMMAIMELSRGHSESAMKSERVGRAWREKKRRAAECGAPVTSRAPAWLRLIDGAWEIDSQAVETIRRIYRMATDGYGIGVIAKRLNTEHVPIVGRGEHWARSYVAKLLGNRAAVGEYQPHTGRGGKRAKDGKPIAGYYPAIITEAEWDATRGSMGRRKGKVGRLPKDQVNIFAGLLHDARSGGTLQRADKGKKGGGRALVPYHATNGAEGAKYVSFPFGTFEAAVLSMFREINPRDILPQTESGPDRTLVLTARLVEVEGEIEKLKVRLQTRYSNAVADVLDRQQAEREVIAKQLATAQQEAASPLGTAWNEAQGLLAVSVAAPDEEQTRVRIRSAVRRIADSIWCLFVGRGKFRLAAVQVRLTGGACRDYLVMHRAGTGGAVGTRAPTWWARSLTEVAPTADGFDLRNRDHAAQLEAALLAVPLAALS